MNVEQLREHIRAVAAAAEERIDELAATVMIAFEADHHPHATGTASSSDDMRLEARRILGLAIRCVAEGRLLSPFEVETIREAVGRIQSSAAQNPAALLRFIRHITRATQHALVQELRKLGLPPNEAVEVIRHNTSATLALSHRIGAAAFETQLHGRNNTTRIREPAPDLLGELLAGETTLATTERCRTAGIILGDAHAVAAIGSSETTQAAEKSLEGLAKWAYTALDRGAYHPVVDVRGGLAVALIAVGPGERPDLAEDFGKSLPNAEPGPGTVLVGVGRWEAGTDGIGASYRQAIACLDLQRVHPRLPPLLTFDEAVPYLLLAESPTLALENYAALVRPLEVHDHTHGTALLPTLEAYIHSGGTIQRVASALNVHRQTVYSRVERIGELTGHDLDLPDHRLLFQLALGARTLLS